MIFTGVTPVPIHQLLSGKHHFCLLVLVLSFSPPEPYFYLEVTVLPKVFLHYCLEVFLPNDVCILMGLISTQVNL